jgi:hypothetical protein
MSSAIPIIDLAAATAPDAPKEPPQAVTLRRCLSSPR